MCERDKECNDLPYTVDVWATWVWTCRSTYMPIFLNSKYCNTTLSMVGLIPGCWTLDKEEPRIWKANYKLYSNVWLHGVARGRAHLTLPLPTRLRCSRVNYNVVMVNDKGMVREHKETLRAPISSMKASTVNISKRMLQGSKILRNDKLELAR